MAELRVVVAGAGGRMGAANIRAVAALDGLALHGAVDRPGSPSLGQDAGLFAGIGALGIIITDDIDAALAGADAIVDFTTPQASVVLAGKAAALGLVHVIGTTGCSEADNAAIAGAAQAGARVVKSGNFSLGVNILASLVRKAAAMLADYDAEILEMHHNRKVDAPSGTALLLGEAVAEGRKIALRDHSVRVRDGHTGPRESGTIGFAILRGGTVVGDHSVIFAGPHERIELNHRAEDRAMFANGAARAVLWAAGKPAGLYSMTDVLGLERHARSCLLDRRGGGDHVRVGREQGFVMFAHGRHSAVKRLQPGDWFAYYSPTETLGGKDTVRRFTAIGTVADGEPEPSNVMGTSEAWMRRAHYRGAQEADIYLLLPQLDFVADPSHWGMYFRKSLFKASAADFSRIADAMGVGQQFTLGETQ